MAAAGSEQVIRGLSNFGKQARLLNRRKMTRSIARVFAATGLAVGLAMTSWSGWCLLKRDAPNPEIDLQEHGLRMCPPSLTELLGIEVPYGTLGTLAVFVAGLVISAGSARHLLPDPEV
jgi:hypothetical protein